MERDIPHVMEVFSASPGRKRGRAVGEQNLQSPGSDSAVSVGSSEEEGEEGRRISSYFDYLNSEEFDDSQPTEEKKNNAKSQAVKPKLQRWELSRAEDLKKSNASKELIRNDKNKKSDTKERKGDSDKDFRYIERHLSMKKTIRKKMMRDLQNAFVEDPKDLQQDPKALSSEKKNNIDINNLTYSKKNLSKSEHNFLDMLKGDQPKERKGLRALIELHKEKTNIKKSPQSLEHKSNNDKSTAPNAKENEPISDADSGHGSPVRQRRNSCGKIPTGKLSLSPVDKRAGNKSVGKDKSLVSKEKALVGEASKKASGSNTQVEATEDGKSDKKAGFWKRFTGTGKKKSKR